MMAFELWLAYVGAVLVLMSTPGPSQLLMMSNSLGQGVRRAFATAAGDLSANVLQMSIAAFGLAGVVHASPGLFVAVQWAGVAYLVGLGVAQMLRRPRSLEPSARRRGLRSLYGQGFATSAANPKAIVFFAALFPQFVSPAAPAPPQFLVLGATYVVMDGLFLVAYGVLAEGIRRRLGGWLERSMNRVSGALLILAGVLLGLRRVPLR